MKTSPAWRIIYRGPQPGGRGLPVGRLAPSSMRAVGFLLTTFALIWSNYGYFISDVDSYLPACFVLLEGALDFRCAPEHGANATINNQLWRSQRRELLGAVWRCQGLLEETANVSSPTKLRVLVWDMYEQWLTPALNRFSELYGIPLDLDVQPFGQLMSSIHMFAGPPLEEVPPGKSQSAFQQPQQQQGSGGAGPHALWLYSSALTQEIAEDGHLLDLGELIEQEQYGIDWFEIGQSYRLQLMPYAARTVAIPLDGTLLHLFYRADVLQTLGLPTQVPKTWTQLVEFTMSYQSQAVFSGGAPGYGALPPYPICIARDVGCRHESYLQAIWSSIAQTHGSTQPIHFDTATMQPLLNSSSAAAAFRILAQLLASAAPPEPDEGCSQGSLAFARGRCVFALAGFVPQMRMLSESEYMGTASPAGGAAVVRVAELPGSELVWDGNSTSGSDGASGTGGLTPCTYSTCPYGISVTLPASAAAALEATKAASEQQEQQQQQQQEVLINRAPQAPTSLLVGGVNSRMPPMIKLVAFELLAFLAAPDHLDNDGWVEQATSEITQTALWSVFPVRPHLLQSAGQDVWLAAGYDMELMEDVMPVLYGSMTHPNIAWGLRMPGQAAYNKLIGDVISSILAGNLSVARWVSSKASTEGETLPSQAGAIPLARVLSSATAKLANDFMVQNASHLYDESRQPWVYSPLGFRACTARGAPQPQAQLPPAQDPARGSPRRRAVLLPVILGVLVPLAVLSFVIVMLVRGYYFRSTTGFDGVGGYGRGVWCLSMALRGPRRIHVPEAGAQVALCVTDIQDSTSLWEKLPADTLARAVDIHHRCVRRLALKHGGYESATEGDSFILAFSSVRSAVAFALDLQTQLLNAPSWPKLLLEEEVCKPVYTRLPAGYPLSNSASGRATGLSPRVRRSSWGVMTAPTAGLTPHSPAAAAAVAPASAVEATTVTGIAEDLAQGSGSGMGTVASANGSTTAARHRTASPITSCADRSRLRNSTGSPLGQRSPRPQFLRCPTTCGSGPTSRDVSVVCPRGRSLGDLIHPSVQLQGSLTAGDGGGVSGGGGGGGCNSTCSGLRFPESAATAVTTPVSLGGRATVAATLSLGHGGSGAAAANMSSYAQHGGDGIWCDGDVGSLGGTSGAEEVDSSPTPVALAVPIRSYGRFKQQLLWLEEPAGSSGSLGQPLGIDGAAPSPKTSMTRRMALSEAGVGSAQSHAILPEEPPEAQRNQMLSWRQQLQQHQQQFMPSLPQQHSPLVLSRGSVVFRGTYEQQSPPVESDLLPAWCDSGFLAHANFSVYSNTTYVTTAEGMAGAGGAVASFIANGRLWDDADGDFISSASNAVLRPTGYQSVALGPPVASIMDFGAQGPAFATAAGGIAESVASPAMAAEGVADRDGDPLAGGGRGGDGGGGFGCRTLLEVLRTAAAAAATGVAGEGLGVRGTSGDPSSSCQRWQPPAHIQQQHNDRYHRNEYLVFRGLRVRVGISVTVPTAAELQYNAAAARMVYGGPCVAACKALADLAHGGQVFLSARAHEALAAECQGLGGKPPGTMVLQVALMESSAPTPQLQEPQANVASSTCNLARNSSLLPPGQGARASHGCHVGECALTRVPEHTPGAFIDRQQQPAVFTPTATYHATHIQMVKLDHQLHIQPSVMQQVPSRVHLGFEPVYVVTSPTLSQRLALVPPPRFSIERPPLQDVYRAPLGRVSYAVVRVPAAAALLRWDRQVAAMSLKLFVRTAVSELRRTKGAYLISASPAEVRAAFPSPVLAVAWALNLRAALLRAAWPEELLQHDLGEPVEAYDGTAVFVQPPSELGVPRLRWMSLAGFGRGNGSRESSAQRGGGGSGSGAAVAESPAPPLPVRFRGSHRCVPNRSGINQAAALSRTELLQTTSPESDGVEDKLGGSLEPLPRMFASPPLRRNRYSLDYRLEAFTQGAVRAAATTILPVDEPPSDTPSEPLEAIGQQAPGSSQNPSNSHQPDYQKRALALLADHFRNAAMAVTAADIRGSESDGGVSTGASGVQVSGNPNGHLPSMPTNVPFRSSPLRGAPTPVGCAFRRATVDGIAPMPQRQHPYHHHQPLLPQQRLRMAVPIAIPNTRSAHRPHHLIHQEMQQQNKGSESAAKAAAAVTPVGSSLPAFLRRSSLPWGATDVQLGEDSITAVNSTEDRGLALDVTRGGGTNADGASTGGTPASNGSSLQAFPTDAAAVIARDPRSEMNSDLHDSKSTLSRLTTWTSPNSHGDGSGTAIRCSGFNVSDTRGRSRLMGGTALQAPGTGHTFGPVIGPGTIPLGAAEAVPAVEGLVSPPSPQPRSAPLFTVPPLSASLHISRRNTVHESEGAVAVITAHAAANAAAAEVIAFRQQVTEGGKKGRLLLRGLRIHVGVATGSLDWTISGKTHALVYTGRAVSRAVRLCEAAASGKVLCDRGTHRGILHVQKHLATATGTAAVQSMAAPPAYSTCSGGLTPPPPRLSNSRTQQHQQPRQEGDERMATAVLGRGLRFGTCSSGGRASLAAGPEEGNQGPAATAGGPSAAVPPATATAVTAAAVADDGIATGRGGGYGGGAEGMLSEQVALELELVRLFAGTRLTVRTLDEVFVCEFRSDPAHNSPGPLQVPVPTSPPPLAASASAFLHQLNGAGAADVAPHHGPQRLQLPAAAHTSGKHPLYSSPRTPQTPQTPANLTYPIGNIQMSCSPAAASQDLIAATRSGAGSSGSRQPGKQARPPTPLSLMSSALPSEVIGEQQNTRSAWRHRSAGGCGSSTPGLSERQSSEFIPLRTSDGHGPRLRPQLSAGAEAETAAGAAVASVDGGGFIVQPPPVMTVPMAAAVASPSQGPLPPALHPSTWSCSIAGTSDCGYMTSLPISSGLLSSTSALPQFSSVARLSPAQRVACRSIMMTTEGNMPYIVCERVDEEAETGSEEGSGKDQRASAAAITSNAVECAGKAGEMIAGIEGIAAPRKLDGCAGRQLSELDLSPPCHVPSKVMHAPIETEASVMFRNGSGDSHGDRGTMPASAPARGTQTTNVDYSGVGGGSNTLGGPVSTNARFLHYSPCQQRGYGPAPVWWDCDDNQMIHGIPDRSQQREVAATSSPTEVDLESSAVSQRTASPGASVVLLPAPYVPCSGGRDILSPAVKERSIFLAQPLLPLGVAWGRNPSSARSATPHLAGRSRVQRPMISAPIAVSGGGGGGGGRCWGPREGQQSCCLHEDECVRDDDAVQGEFEVLPTSSRCCSGPGGTSTTEVTVQALLQGRLLTQMASAAKTDAMVGSTAVPMAQSPLSPALLMTMGSSGRRGSVNISGSSYLYNSGSGGVILNPPTFAGMAQLPLGGPSEASSAGSSFRLVPLSEHLQP